MKPTRNPKLVPQYVAVLGKDHLPVGGGCLVAKRRVVTCAHVVEAAMGVAQGSVRDAPKAAITVYFPFADEPFSSDCRVLLWNPVDDSFPRDENEDLALLELVSDRADSIQPIEVTRPLYDVKVVCYKAGPNGGNAYGTIKDDPVESGRIQINRAETDGIRIEKGFSGVPLITSDVNKLFCGILMTGRQEPTDQTAFGKSPNLIRAIIERDAASDQAQRRLNSEQAAEYVAEKRRVEVGTSNPYLLGKHFYGREREHAQLTRWLCGGDNELQDVRIFCISNLGGTGKSALVHHWLNLPSTLQALRENGLPSPFWASFYSNDFSFPEMLDRLKDYLGISVGRDFVVQGDDAYQRLVVRKILEALQRESALIVLDGLEREMGAFSDSVNRGLDSEQQDVRAESGKVPATERFLRERVFQDLLVGLLATKAKVILTTRHVPEELRDAKGGPRRIHVHELGPLESEDACRIWNAALGQDGLVVEEFVYRFLDLVGYHPHAIVVVAASLANAPDTRSLKQWFEHFDVEQKVRCTDRDALKTSLRHRWIDLATHDLKKAQHKAWLLLVEIAHHASAVQIATLRDIAIRDALNAEKGRPLFENGDLFDEALALLEDRRLVGVSNSSQEVDIHPIIRTHVRQWAFGVFRNPAAADEETLRAVRGDGAGELVQRFWASDIEQQFETLKAADPEQRDQLLGGQSMLRQKLADMYQHGGDKARPWMTRLPKFSHRRVQADCVYLTANALMMNGDWDDSRYLFRAAMELYELCGDKASASECMWSMNWQLIYGGDLLESERTVAGRLLQRDLGHLRTDRNCFWLTLLLGVRKHPLTQRLLTTVKADVDRWTLQAASETGYYLEEYNASRLQILEAIRRDERIERRQELWEWVSLGLAEMRVRRFEQAFESLGRAQSSGIGLGYEIITLFAVAGLTEALFESTLEEANASYSADFLSRGISAHNQYRNLDAQDRYQIPATDAHIAAAKIYEALGQREGAITWGCRALKVARRSGRPFVYASGERRAIEFLQSIGADCVHTEVRSALNAIELMEHEQLISTVVSRIEEGDHADR